MAMDFQSIRVAEMADKAAMEMQELAKTVKRSFVLSASVVRFRLFSRRCLS